MTDYDPTNETDPQAAIDESQHVQHMLDTLEPTEAELIEVQDADIAYDPKWNPAEDDEVGSTTPPNPFMAAMTPEDKAYRDAIAKRNQAEAEAGVVPAHVFDSEADLPGEYNAGQTQFFSPWKPGAAAIVRDMKTGQYVLARIYRRAVEVYEMGQQSSGHNEIAYIRI